MFPLASQQWLIVTPPRQESGAVIAVSAVAGSKDMRTIGAIATNEAAAGQELGNGLTGHYVTLQADSADVYIAVGPTLASVTGGNAPVAATNGTGVIGTPAAGIALKIPNGSSQRFFFRFARDIQTGAGGVTTSPGAGDNFLGFVASGAGQLRIFLSGP